MLEAIGHYQIRRRIGAGGMGVVYEGWDERLQRPVAIKTLHQSSGNQDACSRLWREARSLALVSHPRVCQVFDVLEGGNELFLVLEFLDGQSLAERITAGAIPTPEVVNIERQVLEALEVLHDLRIVHRDLKPSNVFLTRHGVKLLDFGLARSTREEGPGDADPLQTATTLTASGMIMGTPHYMAPEQARGDMAGSPADIFAAGGILYEMLSGKRPFDGASSVDVLYAVLHHDPPPLTGSREIEALDQVIRMAIAKRPEHRYPSAHKMLDALNDITISTSASALVRPQTVTRLIALPFRLLKKDEDTDFLAHSLPDAVSNSLSGIDSLIVRSSMSAAAFSGAADPKQIAAEAGVDAILTGSLLRAGDQIRVTCQLVEAPSGTVLWSETVSSSLQDLFRLQDELSRGIVESLMLPLSERERRSFRRDVPASAKAYEYYLRANQVVANRTADNMNLARSLYLQCLEEDPQYAPAWARLGRVLRFLDKFAENVDLGFERANEAFAKAFALNPDLTIAHNLYTLIECDQGHAQQAMLRLLQRARSRRTDPELFAGLVQACRYCDELDASLAAHFRSSHLDPHAITSAAHTYFLLGEYQKSLEFYGAKAGYYLDCAALAALGDNRTALAKLREREKSGGAPGPILALMRSLRAYLEGNFAECLQLIEAGELHIKKDLESHYYTGRQLALIGETERAIKVLSRVVDNGLLCGSALARDPSFASLRSSPAYSELLFRAEARRSQAHAAFLEAGGPEVLNLSLAAPNH
jgi:eukaryotic-like serine/threonine-protein kinase